jgi:choline kinase
MKAIIFAAGISSRLGELTKDLPKSCLEIEPGLAMIERMLLLLAKHEFSEVRIITGHAKDAFLPFIEKHKSKFKILETLYNDLFKERNNIYTAYLTKNILDESTLIINSDLVIAEKIIELAKNEIHNNAKSFMLIDDHNKIDEESMKVYVTDSGKITRVNKALELEKSLGEYIGILRVSKDDLNKFFSSIDTILENKGFNLYYEDAIDRIASEIEVKALSTQGAMWTEIDTKEDYQKAQELAAKLKKEINTKIEA